jgi:hypothetical protein
VVDRTRPLKYESPGTGGSELDQFQTALNPNQDFVDARGSTFQNDSSDDETVKVTRETDDLTLTDPNAGTKTLSDLAASGSDEKAKVSANDTTTGYLNGKLVGGSGITLVEQNDGGDETLRIDSEGGGSGGGSSLIEVTLNDLDNPHIRATNTSYDVLSRFLFRGTDEVGTPTSIKGIAHHENGSGYGKFRIFDLTNSLQIAESGEIWDVDPVVFDFGTYSNLPTGEAVFEIQGKADTKSAYISSVQLQF